MTPVIIASIRRGNTGGPVLGASANYSGSADQPRARSGSTTTLSEDFDSLFATGNSKFAASHNAGLTATVSTSLPSASSNHHYSSNNSTPRSATFKTDRTPKFDRSRRRTLQDFQVSIRLSEEPEEPFLSTFLQPSSAQPPPSLFSTFSSAYSRTTDHSPFGQQNMGCMSSRRNNNCHPTWTSSGAASDSAGSATSHLYLDNLRSTPNTFQSSSSFNGSSDSTPSDDEAGHRRRSIFTPEQPPPASSRASFMDRFITGSRSTYALSSVCGRGGDEPDPPERGLNSRRCSAAIANDQGQANKKPQVQVSPYVRARQQGSQSGLSHNGEGGSIIPPDQPTMGLRENPAAPDSVHAAGETCASTYTEKKFISKEGSTVAASGSATAPAPAQSLITQQPRSSNASMVTSRGTHAGTTTSALPSARRRRDPRFRSLITADALSSIVCDAEPEPEDSDPLYLQRILFPSSTDLSTQNTHPVR